MAIFCEQSWGTHDCQAIGGMQREADHAVIKTAGKTVWFTMSSWTFLLDLTGNCVQ